MAKTITSQILCNIRDRREEMGLSQTVLSKRSGISNTHISSLERGATMPSLDSARKVAAAMGCTLSELWPLPDPSTPGVIGAIGVKPAAGLVQDGRIGGGQMPKSDLPRRYDEDATDSAEPIPTG